MSYPDFLTILRCRSKLLRFLLLISLLISTIILISPNRDEKLLSPKYENVSDNLINDRLRSHARFFNESFTSCNTTEILTAEQKEHFDKIAQVLAQFRQQTIPLYSENQFNGQGIVLTVGVPQISQCKVNLKMIEHTATRLPVQVK